MATKKKKKAPAHSNGNGGGMTESFTPDRTSNIAGFWRPEKGDSIEGILVEKAETRNGGEYFVLRVTSPVDVISRDKNTDEEIARTADDGREVGISCWADLRGLERKSGHWIEITCLGKVRERGTSGETITRWKTDVQVSKQIHDPKLVYVAPMREPRARGGFRPRKNEAADSPADSDVPF